MRFTVLLALLLFACLHVPGFGKRIGAPYQPEDLGLEPSYSCSAYLDRLQLWQPDLGTFYRICTPAATACFAEDDGAPVAIVKPGVDLQSHIDHEAGHALAWCYFGTVDSRHEISVIWDQVHYGLARDAGAP